MVQIPRTRESSKGTSRMVTPFFSACLALLRALKPICSVHQCSKVEMGMAQVVHLHGIREPGRGRRQPLQKGEKIDALSAFPQAFQKWLRIIQKLVFVRVQRGDSQKPPSNSDVPAANVRQNNLPLLPRFLSPILIARQ